ncbi:hypothetical protein [Cognatiyoonia sediminum]|uniref:hypothetical protein n=1 Tax=Cognatiyoonia sediminum TaxID=1508389 RepID=UPI000934F04B|nr:hypothetical protein [Cognatiyoonia sediminum]
MDRSIVSVANKKFAQNQLDVDFKEEYQSKCQSTEEKRFEVRIYRQLLERWPKTTFILTILSYYFFGFVLVFVHRTFPENREIIGMAAMWLFLLWVGLTGWHLVSYMRKKFGQNR